MEAVQVFLFLGSSLKAGFTFTLVYGDFESNVHQFNINVKVIKNISFVARTIVGFTDSYVIRLYFEPLFQHFVIINVD